MKKVSKPAARTRPADPFGVKPRRSIPFEFVLEALEALQPRTNPMFGCLAVYVGEKIVMVLRDKADGHPDTGVWLATTKDQHASLRQDFPNMRSIGVLAGGGLTGWQLLAADAPDFEESAMRACELICAHDPRIGKVPQRKRKKK